MEEIKRPFLIVALLALTVAFGLEIGSSFLLKPAAFSESAIRAAAVEQGLSDDQIESAVDQLAENGDSDDPPGLAIPALALLDGLLLLSMLGLGLALVVPHRILAKVTAPVNLIASIVVIIVGIFLLVATIALLFLMIGLLLAIPFGFLVYLARWGFFPRDSAQVTLGFILVAKLVFCGFAIVSSPRLLKQKGLMAMIITSLVLQLIVSFLHGLVPLVVVSIADAIAAIIVTIAAIIWAVIILVGSLIGTIRLIKVRI